MVSVLWPIIVETISAQQPSEVKSETVQTPQQSAREYRPIASIADYNLDQVPEFHLRWANREMPCEDAINFVVGTSLYR